jgi:hypothetical protein
VAIDLHERRKKERKECKGLECESETTISVVNLRRGGACGVDTFLQRNNYLDHEFYRNAIRLLD